MTGQQLKNSILQLAIQGKLVPQDPHDEPASVLLEKIRKEKLQLVKEGKLKKRDLEVVPISEDEKLFEIPEGWEWCRIGDMFLHTSGKQQSSSNKGGGTLHKFITTSNLYWNRFELDVVKEMNFTEEEVKTCSATKGDLLVCEGGAGFGRSAIWPFDYDICLQNHVHRLRPLISGTCEYVYYIIYLLKESNRLVSVGTAMPGLSANRLKSILVPLPPLAEQKRIVAKIEELLPLVDEYGKAQDELDKLNTALPEKLRQSILQEAIQGKLVPQDPTEEPASVLLEKIREEKKRLVKEGKLKKKDLEVTPITDDEKPFDLPNGWEWCRHNELFDISGGSQPPKDCFKYKPQDGYIQLYQIRDYGETPIPVYIPIEKASKITQKGDILLARYGGSLGKVFYAEDGAYNVAMAKVIPFFNGSYIYKPFVFYYYKASLYQSLVKGSNRSAQGGFNKEDLGSLLFPLPPLSEQKRIVAKLEELLPMIEGLKK